MAVVKMKKSVFGDIIFYGDVEVYMRLNGFRTLSKGFPPGRPFSRRRPSNCTPVLSGHDGRILIEELEPHNYIFIQENLEVDIV